MKKLTLLATLLLTACGGPLAFSGALAPTEDTFRLTPQDLKEASDASCEQAWFTGNDDRDLAQAEVLLDQYNVQIVWGNIIAAGTAGKTRLYIEEAYKKDNPKRDFTLLLSHELVHYCDRERLGDAQFEARYLHSAGRWVLEVRAYSQTIRSMIKQGAKTRHIEAYVKKRVAGLLDMYALHDIDPEQYERETTRLLRKAAGL